MAMGKPCCGHCCEAGGSQLTLWDSGRSDSDPLKFSPLTATNWSGSRLMKQDMLSALPPELELLGHKKDTLREGS